MNSLLETLPQLIAYKFALSALGVLVIAVLLQAVLQAPLAFAKEDQLPGAPLRGDHTDFSFRVCRTFLNSIENLPMFIGALILAIIAGVSPTWVNWLAGLHVAFRLLFWAVYYSGVGKVAGGPRTLGYIGGWLTTTILAVMALWALVGS